MALTATFTANFSSFYDAVDKAVVKLKDIDASAGKVEKGLDKMVESFSGKKVISEALLMEKAIGGVEGIAKLTEKEIERLGNTTNEAVAKMKKLGQDVPPGLQAIADKTKKADDATIDWNKTLLNMASAVGLAFSVDAVVGFVRGLFDMAGQIQDLSDKLGVSTSAVQGWKFAAEQTGASMEDIGRAVVAMSRNISEGDRSAVGALTELGLKFAEIEAMQPEEAFNVIAAAIQTVPNPMDQARIAMELFGKAGVELLPAIRAGMIDIADAAPKMSDATIRSMDDAADSVDALWLQVKVLSAELINLGMNALDPAAKLAKDLKKADDDLAAASASAGTTIKTKLTASLTAGTGPARSAEAALEEFNKTATKTKGAVDPAAAAILAHNRALQQMADQLTGKNLAKQVDDLALAVQKAGGFAKVTAFEQEKLVKTITDMWLQGAKLPPVLEEIFAKYGAMHVLIPLVSQDMGLLTRQFENQATAVIAIGDQYLEASAKVDWLNDHVRTTAGNMTTLPGQIDWKKWEPPPAVHSAWDDFGLRVGDTVRGITNDFSRSIVDMATGAVSFHDGVLRIWDSIKEGVRRILADMLSTFLNQYIAGLIGGYARYLGYVTNAAIGGGVASGVGAGAGAGGGLGAAAWGPWAAAALPFILGELIIPFSHEDPHYQDQNSGIPGLANAQAMFDYLGPASSVWQDFIAANPQYLGYGNGFARGTHGQYLDFGAGTPVMLHGQEKVVPRGSAEANAGGGWGTTTVIVNAQGAFFNTPQSLQSLASKVSDALTAKYSLQGKLRPAI